jgi:hypothetical protein
LKIPYFVADRLQTQTLNAAEDVEMGESVFAVRGWAASEQQTVLLFLSHLH